jgi:single-stranded-DNA-specific exonuclease
LASADGTRIKAIAFRAMGTELGEMLLTERKLPLHIAGRLTIDEWGAKRVPSLQIEILLTFCGRQRSRTSRNRHTAPFVY